MDDNAVLLLKIWEYLEDFINTNNKTEAAERLVRAFVNNGVDVSDLSDAEGEDPYLDNALTNHSSVDDEESEEELWG